MGAEDAPQAPKRPRAVSVVTGNTLDDMVIDGLTDDRSDAMSYGRRSGPGSVHPSSAARSTRSRGKRHEPVGMKNRDYAFLNSAHPEHAPDLDQLVADYKGVELKLEEPGNEAPSDEVLQYFAAMDKNMLLKKAREQIRQRTNAQNAAERLELDIEDAEKRLNMGEDDLKRKAANLREKQLQLQLQTLELDQSNIELKKKMQRETRKLRSAARSFEDHVEGLETGWGEYVDIRQETRGDANAARRDRLVQFQEQQTIFEDRSAELESETLRYQKLRKEKERVIRKQEKAIRKLSNALGLNTDVGTKNNKRAQVMNPSASDSSSQSTRTWYSDSDSDSDSYTGSSYTSSTYSSDHCSTCGDTLTLASRTSVSATSNASSSILSSLSSLFPRSRGPTLGSRTRSTRSKHSTGSKAEPQQRSSSPEKKKKAKKNGLLTMIYNAVKHPDLLTLQKGKKAQQRSGRGAGGLIDAPVSSPPPGDPRWNPTHDASGYEDPERGFVFPRS